MDIVTEVLFTLGVILLLLSFVFIAAGGGQKLFCMLFELPVAYCVDAWLFRWTKITLALGLLCMLIAAIYMMLVSYGYT